MRVIINQEVHEKIMHWVNKSQFEVSGLGNVVLEKDGVFRVIDAILLPQKNGSTHTDIEGEDVAKAMYLLRNAPGDLKFWWHSHVNMEVFWSGTDRDTIKKIGEGGWFLSTVFNKKEQMRSAFYSVDGMATPFGQGELFIDQLPTTIGLYEDLRVKDWDAEYDKNVTIDNFSILGYDSRSPWSGAQHTPTKSPVSLIDPLKSKDPIDDYESLSKRQIKKLKKRMQEDLKHHTPTITDVPEDDEDEDDDLGNYQDEYYYTEDVQGVTPYDRQLLRSVGVDRNQITELLGQGFSLQEILEHHVTYQYPGGKN